MTKLVIEEYWNKVDRTGCKEGELGKVLPEYELKSRLSWPDSRNTAQLRRDTRRFKRTYKGEIEPGVFKHDLGSHCGINSYQLVYLIND